MSDEWKCVNAHDRCYGGAGGPCDYCERTALSPEYLKGLEAGAAIVQRAADNPLTRIGGGPEIVDLLTGLASAIRALKETPR